ncbi:MAG: ATP-binding protein [Promethearchaeota archaeon]
MIKSIIYLETFTKDVLKITLNTSSINITIQLPKISILPDLCTGCGICAEICPFGIPQPDGNGKFEIIEPERCTECSACKRNCPAMAILLQEHKGCGCLWDARARSKNPRNNSCCG